MKTVHRIINKNLKMILIVAAATAVALGILLLLISGNQERNKIPNEPNQAVKPTEEPQEQTVHEETTVEKEQGVSQGAQNLFNAKVASIGDSPGIARLLETIDLKKNVANYMVELQAKKDPKSMTINFDKTINQKERKNFDENMQKYAEQILALVTDLNEVQWVYTVEGEDKVKDKVTVFLNIKGATELLRTDVKKYGESAKMVQTLLNQQKGY